MKAILSLNEPKKLTPDEGRSLKVTFHAAVYEEEVEEDGQKRDSVAETNQSVQYVLESNREKR